VGTLDGPARHGWICLEELDQLDLTKEGMVDDLDKQVYLDRRGNVMRTQLCVRLPMITEARRAWQ
jgi:hypothetical protein